MALIIQFPPDSPEEKMWNRICIGGIICFFVVIGFLGWLRNPKTTPNPSETPPYKQEPIKDSGGFPPTSNHSGRY